MVPVPYLLRRGVAACRFRAVSSSRKSEGRHAEMRACASSSAIPSIAAISSARRSIASARNLPPEPPPPPLLRSRRISAQGFRAPAVELRFVAGDALRPMPGCRRRRIGKQRKGDPHARKGVQSPQAGSLQHPLGDAQDHPDPTEVDDEATRMRARHLPVARSNDATKAVMRVNGRLIRPERRNRRPRHWPV